MKRYIRHILLLCLVAFAAPLLPTFSQVYIVSPYPRYRTSKIRRPKKKRVQRPKAKKKKSTAAAKKLIPRPPLTFDADANVNPAPAIGPGNTIYVADGSPDVYAVNKVNGHVLWHFTAGGAIAATPAIGPNGTIYVTSYDHNVYALDGQTGAKKWQFATKALVATTPAVGNDLVYVGGFDNTLYALTKTGVERWHLSTTSSVASPIVGPGGVVYIGADDVYALNGRTGKVLWAFPNGFVGDDMPVLDTKSNTLYVGAHDGTLYALDAATGGCYWRFPTSGVITSPPVLGSNDSLYFASDKLYCLYARGGNVRWEVGSGANNWAWPTLSVNDIVYAGCANQSIYAVDIVTGKIRWGFPVPDGLTTAPSVGPAGQVYLTDNGTGQIYSINGLSGDASWQVAPPAPNPPKLAK